MSAAAAPGAVLVLNAGSSSLKASLFETGAGAVALLGRRRFEDLGAEEGPRVRALDEVLAWCQAEVGATGLAAVAHRVVHGGASHADPVLMDDDVLAGLESLVPLAPLHQPWCLAPIRFLLRSRPGLAQVACFDTAFHGGRAPVACRYGLPDALHREGIRRYGFHGLSYESVAASLAASFPEVAGGRVIVAHLGSGCSMCAMSAGRSVDTTMGFSALDGLVMSTRCGSLDPGVVLHLLRDGSRTVADVERMLYRESGLLGVSGTSGDVRELLASGDPRAREALDLFVWRIVRELGAMTAVLGGLDALVFTAGIGEHSAAIRARVVEASAWTGLALDAAANGRGDARISAPHSKVLALVVPTDEESAIARHAARLLAAQGCTSTQ